jgi:hypothetical protein
MKLVCFVCLMVLGTPTGFVVCYSTPRKDFHIVLWIPLFKRPWPQGKLKLVCFVRYYSNFLSHKEGEARLFCSPVGVGGADGLCGVLFHNKEKLSFVKL